MQNPKRGWFNAARKRVTSAFTNTTVKPTAVREFLGGEDCTLGSECQPSGLILADPHRPVLYAIYHELRSAQLLIFSPHAPYRVFFALDVGNNVTDFSLNHEGTMLMITNHGGPVFSVALPEVLSTCHLGVDCPHMDAEAHRRALLHPGDEGPRVADALDLGPDSYHINCGREGNVIVEGEDQWVDARQYHVYEEDSQLCADLVTSVDTLRAGDGSFSPCGNYYYRIGYNSGGESLVKYRSDAFAEEKALYRSPFIAFGANRIVIARGSGRIFYTPYSLEANRLSVVCDSDCGIIDTVPTRLILACSYDGTVAISEDGVYGLRGGILVPQTFPRICPYEPIPGVSFMNQPLNPHALQRSQNDTDHATTRDPSAALATPPTAVKLRDFTPPLQGACVAMKNGVETLYYVEVDEVRVKELDLSPFFPRGG